MGEIGTGRHRDGGQDRGRRKQSEQYHGRHEQSEHTGHFEQAEHTEQTRQNEQAGQNGQNRQDLGYTTDPDSGPLSDATAERLLDTPWAVRFRLVAQNGSATRNGNSPSNASYLPGFEDSAVAPDPARMKYSAGWDGADDESGHAGARGTAGPEDPQGLQDPAAAGGARWRDHVAGSTDSGGETTTMSSVDYPADLASPDAQAVARILAAAAAPARPHELRGYETARRAFERAGATPVQRGFGTPLRRLIGVKMAAVAGALTVTGVAVAAEADVLPAPIQKVAHQMLGGVGVPDPDPDPTSQSAAPGTSSSSSSTHPGTPRPTGPSGASASSSANGGAVPGTPSGTADGSGQSSSADADVPTLCRAYTDQQQGKGAALSGKDRRRLATLAGGEDKIDDFCAKVLATAPPGQQSENPVGSTGSPSPSKDHKPDGTTTPPAAPPSTSGDGGNSNGHSHTPSPSHPTH